MVGYAFMGAAHSQAWRNAPRFFDLPLRPRMTALAGRDAARVAAGRRPAGLGVDRDVVAGAGRARRHRPGRRLHARRHPRRDRHRRARGRQARAVREAAGQHRRGGRGDDARRREGRGRRRPVDGRLHLPTGAGDRPGPPAGRRGPARDHPPRAGAVPAGLDRRPGGPAVLAAGQGEGRLRGPRRHRRAHRRPHPAHHRRRDRPGLRAAARPSSTSGRCRPSTPGCPARPAPAADPVTVDDAAVFLARVPRRRAGRLRGDPVRDRPQERDPHRDQRLAPAAWPSTSRT